MLMKDSDRGERPHYSVERGAITSCGGSEIITIARPVLQQVVRSYPDSPFAQRAQETLVVLDRSR